jgi:hypothetical protein
MYNNVGIGTTSPSTRTHLDGDTDTILRIDSQNSASDVGTVMGEIQLHGKYHTASALHTGYGASIIKNVKDSADGTGGTALTLSTSQNAGSGVSEKMRITKAGLVGIGTTAPAEELHILAAAPTIKLEDSDNNYAGYINGSDGNVLIQTLNTARDVIFGENAVGAEIMRVDMEGNIGIGTSAPDTSLHIAKTSTALTGTTNGYGVRLYPTGSGACYLDALTSSTSSAHLRIRTYNNTTYNEWIFAADGSLSTAGAVTVTGTVTATAGATLLIKDSSGSTLKTIKGMS